MSPSNGFGAEGPRTQRFGLFELDLRAGELRRSGIKVKLQEQPFQILALLLERPGEVVTREDLRNRLWPADTFVDFDHSLNAAIKRLRDALGDSAENPTFVETVARRGYRFLAPVSSSSNGNGNGALAVEPSIPEVSSPGIAAPPVKRLHFWLIAGGVAALILVLGGIKLGLSLASHHTPPAPRITRLTANPAEDRILSAAISRDGKYLAFTDETGFYLRQIDTGETRPLTLPHGLTAGSLSWFPDSVHLVATLHGNGSDSDLWDISTLSGETRRLYNNAHSPAVSPDGSQVAFITGERMNESVWVMASDATQARRLTGKEGDFFGAIAWSPDGTRIVYTRAVFSYGWGVTGTIELANLRDGKIVTLIDNNSIKWFANLQAALAWASDGRIICSLTEPVPRQSDSNVWALTINKQGEVAQPPTRLTNDPGTVLSISVSGDGKRIAYAKGVPQPDVYVAKVDGGNIIGEPQRLTLDDRQDIPFDWTLDGKTVIFISDRTGVFNVYSQHIDQTVPEVLVGGTHSAITPRLSPDGTQLIYFVAPDLSGTPPINKLMTVPLAGGAPWEILQATGLSNQQCARAPASLCIYSIVSAGTLTLFRFDPTKGSEGQIYQIKDPLPQDYNWTLSPDGTTLAIAKWKKTEGATRIQLVSLNSNAEKWLTLDGWSGLTAIDWAADGKHLWVTSAEDEENALFSLDLEGHARMVWRPKKMQVRWAIPSRDGQSLALHVNSSSSNVWMLEEK